ncbi:MAG: cation transporter [Actinomycetota bacterium]|nr:cation transporter [Actinomycetota bacterium]
MSTRDEPAGFGHTELPEPQRKALRSAIRLEWTTLGVMSLTVFAMYLVLGSSQAMQAAWVEDLLSLLPPIAFLVACRIIRLRPTEEHPYGFHRATAIAHLVAAVALLVMGAYLLFDSALTLIEGKHPTIGGVTLFGQTFWLGWLMILTLAASAVAPIILGRRKLKLSEVLHDKVLYADADMNKADWATAVSGIVGVTGIGLGLWWADAAAAIVISASILHDGIKNLRAAVAGLSDTRARTYDDADPDPVGDRIDALLDGLRWVERAKSRVRDQGHVYHVESFVVPTHGKPPSLDEMERAREACIDLDWKVQDMVIVLAEELPEEYLPGLTTGDARALGASGEK